MAHDKLMACLRMRVVDRSVLKLIRLWLEKPVEPGGDSGGGPESGAAQNRARRTGESSPPAGECYTFRWDRDLYGSNRLYLNVEPSGKPLKSNELTDRRQGCTPLPRLIQRLNRQLKGWANCFSWGYPRKAYRKINWHVGYRLANHLKHQRSQRPYRLPEGTSYYEHPRAWSGLPEAFLPRELLTRVNSSLPVPEQRCGR